jgi:peptidoglycan/xylan/chitin deacetylase (PgdA/CDA1 family)
MALRERAVTALRRGAAGALKAAAVAADRVRPAAPGIPVLLYHRVGGARPGEVNLSPPVFAAQLAHLVTGGGVLSLDEALERLDGPPPTGAGEPPVVLTFDDGTADFAEVAVPLLVEYRVPATLYLATRWVEEGRSFWDDGTVLSWAALRDAVSTGLVTVGSHTHSHALLDRLPPEEVATELERSAGLIEDRLGVACEHFAYPKALPPSPGAERAVRARFRSAALAGTRPNPYGATDPYRLARSPVQVADGMRWFRHKATGGMRLEDDVRALVNRRRYAGAAR